MTSHFDGTLRYAIYRHFVDHAAAPSLDDMARALDASPGEVRAGFARLAAARMIVLGEAGDTIRMAAPFSGIPTAHVAHVSGRRYFANCGWDLLGVFAALGQPGRLESRCGQTGEALSLNVSLEAPPDSSWVFHTPVPAARWWNNIVDT